MPLTAVSPPENSPGGVGETQQNVALTIIKKTEGKKKKNTAFATRSFLKISRSRSASIDAALFARNTIGAQLNNKPQNPAAVKVAGKALQRQAHFLGLRG